MIDAFTTSLAHDGFMNIIMIPEEVKQKIDTLKAKRVIATVESEVNSITIHAGIAKKKDSYYIMFSKANQKILEVNAHDMVKVTLQEDLTKYQAPMTEELEAVLLSDYEGYELFEQLLPGKKRNIIFMIYNLKDSQKRVDAALNALENLKIGNMDPMRFEKLIY